MRPLAPETANLNSRNCFRAKPAVRRGPRQRGAPIDTTGGTLYSGGTFGPGAPAAIPFIPLDPQT
jgi:hypothetical protein